MGLALVAAAPAILLITALAWRLDVGDEIGFFIAPIVGGGVGSFLVYRFGRWAKILGLILGVLAFMGFWWTVFGLFLPGSFFDFVPAVMFVPGAFIAIGSCIAAIVAGRRGHAGSAPSGGERSALRIAMVAIAALTVLSGILTLVGKSTADASRATATVAMTDFKFVPQEPIVAAGSTILLRNDDPFMHTFTIDSLKIDVQLNPGSSELVTIRGGPGTYPFYCEPHGTSKAEKATAEDMNGTLTLS